MKLPPMPPLRQPSGKPRAKGKRPAHSDLDREVQWRQGVEGETLEHVYGTCAKCGTRRQAIDLVWRPDRLVFGELHLGFWCCKDECPEMEG